MENGKGNQPLVCSEEGRQGCPDPEQAGHFPDPPPTRAHLRAPPEPQEEGDGASMHSLQGAAFSLPRGPPPPLPLYGVHGSCPPSFPQNPVEGMSPGRGGQLIKGPSWPVAGSGTGV